MGALVRGFVVSIVAALAVGCSQQGGSAAAQQPAGKRVMANSATTVAQQPLKEAYFGDLHLHTALSIDAFITGTRTMPDDAYRYAKGQPIDHVSGQKIQLKTALDFLAVTDHSELIGVAYAMDDPQNPLAKLPIAAQITSHDFAVSQRAFAQIVQSAASGNAGNLIDPALAREAMGTGWQRLIDAAQRNYEPGKFTTFVAYEWSSMPNLANLHRNVIFRGANVPPMPFSSVQSKKPEELWAFLDNWRAGADDVIAIPHNSNASKGLMSRSRTAKVCRSTPLRDRTDAQRTARRSDPIQRTSRRIRCLRRTTNSPISNCGIRRSVRHIPVEPVPGSYVRNAYGRGLAIEQQVGVNPYKFGLVGASDSHDASSAVEENNFTGGHGNADATPQIRLHGQSSTLVSTSLRFSASGLTGVWAESNTREAIFDALRRKETFATTGPHIRARFFGGANYPADLDKRSDAVARAYAGGVPMGGDLKLAPGAQPTFFTEAMRDPNSGALARIQIVKVWAADGKEQEAIFDVACSNGGRADPTTHRCPDNGATVDLATCKPSADKGAAQLAAVWRDTTYATGQRAAYYVRVLENPTCRWSTWDALRLGEPPPQGVAATIQERAFTSPIWVAAK